MVKRTHHKKPDAGKGLTAIRSSVSLDSTAAAKRKRQVAGASRGEAETLSTRRKAGADKCEKTSTVGNRLKTIWNAERHGATQRTKHTVRQATARRGRTPPLIVRFIERLAWQDVERSDRAGECYYHRGAIQIQSDALAVNAVYHRRVATTLAGTWRLTSSRASINPID